MSDTIPCPGCRAELVLPGLPEGETVQCPRCQHVFEAIRGRAAPVSAAPRRQEIDDVGDEVASDPPLMPSYQPFRGQWKAPVAMLFLMLSALSYGMQLFVNWEDSRLLLLAEELGQPLGGRPIGFRRMRLRDDLHQRRNAWASTSESAAVWHHLIFWPTVFFTMTWLNQAARNLRFLRAFALRFQPALAVFSFFIPFVNLLLPYRAVQEIWRASDPSATRDPTSWQGCPGAYRVLIWWLSFLAAAVFSLAARWSENMDWWGEDFAANILNLRQARLWCASNFCMIVAGAALIWVIHGIRARQRDRHARVYDEAA